MARQVGAQVDRAGALDVGQALAAERDELALEGLGRGRVLGHRDGLDDGLRHDMQHFFHQDDTHLAEALVTYTRRDGSLVTVPAMSVFHTRADGLIDSYRIYVDLAPLYA